jgi:hypothetical protein
MIVPEEFKKVCRGLNQDVGLFVNNENELVDAAIDGLMIEERRVVRIFLDEILSKGGSGASLRNIWRAAGSDVYFPNAADLLTFLTLLRLRLG